MTATYGLDVKQEYGAGTDLLQAPIGKPQYVTDYFDSHIKELEQLTVQISSLEYFQVALTLLRRCACVCRMVYLLRTVPTAVATDAVATFDVIIESALRQTLGGVLPFDRFRDLHLPLHTEKPTFCIGFGCAKTTSSSAFLASTSQVDPIIKLFLGAHPASDAASYLASIAAHIDWKGRIAEEDVIDLPTILTTKSSQKDLKKLVIKQQVVKGRNDN